MVVRLMKPWSFDRGGSRVPHSGGAGSPRLKEVDEGSYPTPRRGDPDYLRFSPVCLLVDARRLTGRGSYHLTGFNDIGVFDF